MTRVARIHIAALLAILACALAAGSAQAAHRENIAQATITAVRRVRPLVRSLGGRTGSGGSLIAERQ